MAYTISLSDDDLRRFCALPGPDALAPDMVRRHAPDAALLEDEHGAPAGRASLWWRAAPAYHRECVGLIGHYAAADPAVASRLLDAACARLADAGCTMAIGPMDGSTWRRYRLLTERGGEPTFFMEPDNPDEWPAHFAGSGFKTLAQYYSALCEDLGAVQADDPVAQRLRGQGFTVRPIEVARIDAELSALWTLATDAFAGNLLYTPIDQAEFRSIYTPLLPVLQPQLVLIAEHGGRAVGFSLAVPDVMQARHGQSIDTVVFKTLGVASSMKQRGIGKWLFDCTIQAARALRFRRAIYALIHADNPSGRLAHPSGRDFRRYALYARRL
jgi:GNAT superfamily N-acetyltransferase